jgi:hypothetical protein
MLPYPYGHTDVYRAAFCQREKNVVRKKPECWTCSWCEPGSDAMVSAAPQVRYCKVTPMIGGGNGRPLGSPFRRAA